MHRRPAHCANFGSSASARDTQSSYYSHHCAQEQTDPHTHTRHTHGCCGDRCHFFLFMFIICSFFSFLLFIFILCSFHTCSYCLSIPSLSLYLHLFLHSSSSFFTIITTTLFLYHYSFILLSLFLYSLITITLFFYHYYSFLLLLSFLFPYSSSSFLLYCFSFLSSLFLFSHISSVDDEERTIFIIIYK